MTNRIQKWDEVHGTAEPDPMSTFIESTTDGYAILQLRRNEDTAYGLFASMKELERMGLEPDIDHYEVVYTAPLPTHQSRDALLEDICVKFNVANANDAPDGASLACDWMHTHPVDDPSGKSPSRISRSGASYLMAAALLERPEDFYGHSLSVSDIVAVKEVAQTASGGLISFLHA